MSTSVAGLLVAVTTVLQYVLKYEEKANANKLAANDFSNIKREIEEALLGAEPDMNKISEIKFAHAFAAKRGPIVSVKE